MESEGYKHVWMSGRQLKVEKWISEKKGSSGNPLSGKIGEAMLSPSMPSFLQSSPPMLCSLPLGLFAKSDSFLTTSSEATTSKKSSPERTLSL